MSDTKKPPTKAEVMPILANVINNVLVGSFGENIEFLLVIAIPSDEPDYVELSTITGITDPGQLRAVAHHVNDLARVHLGETNELVGSTDVHGHG